MQNAWIWIVGIVLVAVGGFLWWQDSVPVPSLPAAQVTDSGTEPIPSTTPASVSSTTQDSSAAMSATVTYSASGFSPSSVTIKKGGTVTFNVADGSKMWVATDAHPEHEGYDATSRSQHCASGYVGEKPFDQCAAGATYSFTFEKIGSWSYHNHSDQDMGGTIVVVE